MWGSSPVPSTCPSDASGEREGWRTQVPQHISLGVHSEKFLMFAVISKIGKLVKAEGVVTFPNLILNKIINKCSIVKQVCLAWCLRVSTAVLNLMSWSSLRVERIYFSSQFIVHRPGKTRQNSELEPGGRIWCGGYGGYGGTLPLDWPS